MMVDMAPLGSMGRSTSGLSNLNPTIATTKTSGVQVVNMLDDPAPLHALEQFANIDTGLLEGIPDNMFHWGKRESPHSTGCRAIWAWVLLGLRELS